MSHDAGAVGTVPLRQVRAVFDEQTITVYQAFSAEIARPAVRAGTFVEPFKMTRMTWIKPSFLWMMYRCGWASKPGQERVLAIRMTRQGFDGALSQSCWSHFEPQMHETHEVWKRQLRETSVRVQWDPERTWAGHPLSHRSLQIGLSGSAVREYVADWIHDITDITDLVHQLHREGPGAEAALPTEAPYPLPSDIAHHIGAKASASQPHNRQTSCDTRH